MKINIKFLCLFIVQIFVSILSIAQNIIILNQPETGDKVYKAKQAIIAQPGFRYIATPTNSLRLYIDPNDIAIDNVVNYEQFYDDFTFDNRTLNESLLVGTISGTENVAADGSASYTVPINIPKGTGGMEPTISINYNNRNGNGLLGVGWSLGGISMISRVQPTIYHDNTIQPITYTNTDRFVLDGNRLIATSGTYGANNTQYGTEIESFSKIISYTSTNFGPDRFTVETKNGLTMEYGNDQYAKVTSVEGKTLMWFLSKIYDKNGNYVEYKYKHINDTKVLDKIIYTGNTNTGLQPYNALQFDYAVRPDSNTMYKYGHRIYNNLVLQKIKALTQNQLFREYEFKYSKSLQTSFLKEIIEKGNNNEQYNSTVFKYNSLESPFSSSLTPSFDKPISSEYITADFNADGATDFLEISNTANAIGQGFYLPSDITVYQNDHFSNFHSINASYLLPSGQQVQASDFYPYNQTSFGHSNLTSSDFNGDGFEDLCFLTKTNTTFYVNILYNTTGTSGGAIQFSNPQQTAQFSIVNTANDIPNGIRVDDIQLRIGDFDGDTKADIMIAHLYGPSVENFRVITANNTNVTTVYYKNAKINVFLNNNFTTPVATNTFTFVNTSEYISFKNAYPVDLNGDGITEITGIESSIRDFYTVAASATTISLVTEPIISTANNLYFSESDFKNIGDFNGDGNTDILYGLSSGSNFNYSIAYGGGNHGINGLYQFITKSIVLAPPSSNNQYSQTKSNSGHIVVDLNGDGKTDIIEFQSTSAGNSVAQNLKVFISTGAAFLNILDKNYSLPGSSLIGGDTRLNLGDFDGDGGVDLFLFRVYNVNNQLQTGNTVFKFNFSPKRTLLQGIANGLNQKTFFSYQPINGTGDGIPYTSQNDAAFPVMDFNGAFYVVDKVVKSNGTNDFSFVGFNELNYDYEGAKIHRQGKGFLGFMKTTIEEGPGSLALKKIIRTNLLDPNSFILLPQQEQIFTQDGTPISSTQTNISAVSLGNKRFWIKTNSATSHNFVNDINTNTVLTYDSYGNITQSQAIINNGLEENITTTTFGQFGTWIPASPETITITNTRNGEAAITKTTSITYDNIGRTTQSVEFDGQPKSITTNFTYDALGNVISNSVQTQGASSRTSQFTFDAQGRYIKSTINPLSQITENTLHPIWGSPVKVKGVDGLEVLYEYNGMGRLIKTTAPDGIIAEQLTGWALQSGINGATYFAWLKHPTQPDEKTFYSHGGYPLKTEKEGFNQSIFTQTKYFPNGLIHQKIAANNGTGGEIITYQYDKFGRILQASNTIGNTSYAYAAQNGQLTVTITPPSGQAVQKTMDATGKLIKATDNAGDIIYNYYSNGQIKDVNNLGVLVATMEYDNMGQQTKLIDKNAGTLLYNYNGFGELLTQTDANNNNYAMQYDALGQILQRSGPDGVTQYEYVTSGAAVNSLSKITAPNGTTKEFIYDNLGRTQSFTEKITGQQFINSYVYDANNNLTEIIYPSGFKIKKEYNNNGYITKVKNGITDELIYELLEVNAYEQITKYKYGNGIVTEKTYDNLGFLQHITAETANNIMVQDWQIDFNLQTGNVNYRKDNLKNLTENFTYDNLNRLTQSQVIGLPAINVNYSQSGNITSKTDAGTYTYDNNKTNAVVSVTNPDPNISLLTQNITYTPFNKTEKITEDDYELNFTYDADYKRIKTELKKAGQVQYTRYFASGYEKTIFSAVTQELHYINCGGGLSAIYTVENGVGNMFFIHKDHLGSLLTITDQTGAVIAEQNFDAWGRKRNPQNWTYTLPGTAGVNWLYRGYTGHEHLTEFAIVNMNGRCYDPIVARMLSADNFVQESENTQSFNRYSYVMNNPLKYTDPSGEIGILGSIIGGFTGFYQGYQIGMAKTTNFGKRLLYGMVGGFIGSNAGLLGTYIAGSSLPFSGTLSIIASSFVNSIGNHALSGGETDVTVGFGFGSYNFTSDELKYVGKKGNSPIENFGYGVGAFANLSDIYGFAMGAYGDQAGELDLITKNDLIGHTELRSVEDRNLISVGPDYDAPNALPEDNFWDAPGTNNWDTHAYDTGIDGLTVTKIRISNVRLNKIDEYVQNNLQNFRYKALSCNCVTSASNALLRAGVLNIPFLRHPSLLQFQMFVRQNPYVSSYMYNYRK